MHNTGLPSNNQERSVLTVSRLNMQARQLLETHLPLIWVEGELSNVARPSSGHWYFTLKDSKAQVRCAMFRNRNQSVRFAPEQGQQVLLRARVSLYEGRGDYQLIAEHMEDAGAGALQKAFDELKYKLNLEGLFDSKHKKTLPTLPRHIGVITSPTGAAIRDILSVLERRFSGIPITVIPVAVQGTNAAPQIVQALERANKAKLFDVLIVSRGGGSLEDLWPFNEERVARAIFDSEAPVISAVGHEIDVSISDFVADMRAATPSAAAEIVTPDVNHWRDRYYKLILLLEKGIKQTLAQKHGLLLHLQQRLRHPGTHLRMQAQHLDQLELRLQRAQEQRLLQSKNQLESLIQRQNSLLPNALLKQNKKTLKQLAEQLSKGIHRKLEYNKQQLTEAARLLHSVSPLNTLDRGYAIVTTLDGCIISNAKRAVIGGKANIQLAKGQLNVTINKIL